MKYNNSKYEILSPEGFVDFLGIQKLSKKTIEIFFDNNISLRGSNNHKIYDYNSNEMLLSDIKIGDKIESNNGFLQVVDIVIYNDDSDVYDIINSGSLHLYYTNGIISHNCNFLGSGDNVFDSNLMSKIYENMITEPVNKMFNNLLWLWKEPIVGHKYIMGLDASRGDSEDFSSLQIIDFDTREQVAEYVGKIPPDILAELAYKWGLMYSAFIVIDITGGMGVATARKLQELGYKDLYVDGVDLSNRWKYDPKMLEKIPGINFNNKRVQIIASFEEVMRHGFKVYSTRLYNEMNTFVYINGRPDHQKGHHDDLIMAIAMATYVAETSFTNLTKVTEQAKSMLDSWTVNTNDNSSKVLSFNPSMPNDQVQKTMLTGREEVTKQDYMKYGWLFGGMR